VGKVFWEVAGQKLPQEPSRLAGLLCGLAQPPSWWTGEEPVSLAHAKGAVEYLAEGLNLPPLKFVSPKPAPPYLDPAACSQIRLNNDILGEVGRLSEQTARTFDLDRPVFIFDLDFDLLVQKSSPERRFAPLPRFPEVMRDIAIVVAEKVGAGEVLAAARTPESGRAREWLKEVALFDLYRGKPLAAGQKSLGLRFTYRDEERTLTEKEVQPLHDNIVQSLLERFKGVLR
jgi:phenylalanyl-tRNA synthetase beta chain